MTHLPFIDAALIERFLRAQGFRHPATHKNYAGILCNFNSFLTALRRRVFHEVRTATEQKGTDP
ncbi:hypothetical protein ACFQ3P_43650, partial [Paraburkholderia sabiae]|nr:hypothetical protein [Paraburkholderia sabiae]WJZ79871.1 hypothetical protein QEN71_44525 [Paraburkholderia sabiae]